MEWLDLILNANRTAYFIRQSMIIIVLFLVGFIVLYSIKSPKRVSLSLAYPVGLSVFILLGYIFIVLGIPYNAFTMGCGIALVLVVSAFCVIKSANRPIFNPIRDILTIFLVVALVCVCVSGVTWISISNDSMYYFWQYPRAIVRYQGIRDQFDNFMTDTGLGAAIIGTMPFLYDFGETFGMQEFFHLSFLAFVGNGMWDLVGEVYPSMSTKKKAAITFSTILLIATATPVFILSHWAMANMYFMELFLMAIFVAFYIKSDGNKGLWLVLGLLFFFNAQIRMEGGIFILFMVLMLGTVLEDSRKLALSLCPIVVLQTIFEVEIFVRFRIDSPYTFMTKEKAALQFVLYVFMIAYLLLKKKIYRFASEKISRNIEAVEMYLIVGALFAVNVLLLVIEPAHYIANIKAFVGNMLGQSGWGIMTYAFVMALLVMLVYSLVVRGKISFKNLTEISSFFILLSLGFLLVSVAVAFARGDNLLVATGDSGNRVLLQIAPIVIIAMIMCFVDIGESNGESEAK